VMVAGLLVMKKSPESHCLVLNGVILNVFIGVKIRRLFILRGNYGFLVCFVVSLILMFVFCIRHHYFVFLMGFTMCCSFRFFLDSIREDAEL